MIDINKYKEVICPICGEFYFSALEPGDADLYDYVQCSICGWKYDADQLQDPELSGGPNEISLNEYKKMYEEKKKADPNYIFVESEYEEIPHICPVCGKHTFTDYNSFEICPVCGWEDDAVMEENPDEWGGCSNDLPLTQFKRRFELSK